MDRSGYMPLLEGQLRAKWQLPGSGTAVVSHGPVVNDARVMALSYNGQPLFWPLYGWHRCNRFRVWYDLWHQAVRLKVRHPWGSTHVPYWVDMAWVSDLAAARQIECPRTPGCCHPAQPPPQQGSTRRSCATTRAPIDHRPKEPCRRP